MNEHIEMLFKQAGGYVEVDSDGNYFTYTQDFDPEKFALLITKECINVVETLSPGYDDYRNQIEDAFRIDCIDQLKQKLGVEV
jgi:hypothetical protein